MSFIFLELGINPENSNKTLEPSFKNKELVEKYSKEMVFVSRLFTKFLSDWRPKNLRKIAILTIDLSEKEATSSLVLLIGLLKFVSSIDTLTGLLLTKSKIKLIGTKFFSTLC